MSTEITTALVHRDERHEVSVALDVAGAPVIEWKDCFPAGHAFTPFYVRLTYSRNDAQWDVWAKAYGERSSSGRDVWAAFETPLEKWPAWLRELAEQYCPCCHSGQGD